VEATDAVSGVPHWEILKERIANGWAMQCPVLMLPN